MSREIKFRAWDGKRMAMNPLSLMAPDFPMNELMQFTGLKDRKGVEIYEGDRIEWSEGEDDIQHYTVRWSDAIAAFFLDSDEDPEYSGTFNLFSLSALTVIGNIYENPELLNSATPTK